MKKDYSQLPAEIIEKIATEHLKTFSQLVTFSGICTPWRSAALDLYIRRRLLHLRRQMPSLLISKTTSYYEDDNINTTPGAAHYRFKPIFNGNDPNWSPPDFVTRRRMRLLSRKTLEGREKNCDHLGLGLDQSTVEVDLEKCHCVASRDGWLVLAVPHPSSPLMMYLLNPVTGVSIPLPPLDHFEFGLIGDFYCILLSSSPDNDDCHAIVVNSEETIRVAWCKVGGGHWNIETKDSNSSNSFDVAKCATYFGDKLYVVDYGDRAHVFSNLIDATETVLTVNKLVRQSSSSDYRWEEVTSLDGYAVFLGTHQSLCVPVSNNNNKMMVKGNHIYCVAYSCGHCDRNVSGRDHWRSHAGDCGVYSLEHRKFVEHFQCREKFHDYIWFSPMPWDVRKHLKRSNRRKGLGRDN
ncbi:hypothetical protein LINGRAHAP2_LOCUS9103 [Linum grandiflorum]